VAISSTKGAKALQGPHHGAQKSTKTGTEDCFTSCSKELSVTSNTLADMVCFFLNFPELAADYMIQIKAQDVRLLT
jgi:hypothetical protein